MPEHTNRLDANGEVFRCLLISDQPAAVLCFRTNAHITTYIGRTSCPDCLTRLTTISNKIKEEFPEGL